MKKSLKVQIAEIIEDSYNVFDGFVVLHGSDTMSYTASALSFIMATMHKMTEIAKLVGPKKGGTFTSLMMDFEIQ